MRKKIAEPEIKGSRDLPKQFKLDHCYRYPWNKKDREEYLVFLINLYAPTKSGYLLQSESKMWRCPNITTDPKLAYTCLCAPQDIGELTIRRQYIVPRYFVVVLVPKAEAVKWKGKTSAWKNAKEGEVKGEIKYY